MDRLPTRVARVENLPEKGPEGQPDAPDPIPTVLFFVALREEVSGEERLQKSLEAGPVRGNGERRRDGFASGQPGAERRKIRSAHKRPYIDGLLLDRQAKMKA